MAETNLVRKAVIDLGTNTFNLLIASVENGKLHNLFSDKLPVLLGMGGINKGIIAQDAMSRAKEALQSFAKKSKDFNVEKIMGIGTSALRGAANANELIRYSEQELSIPIEIVSGNREAELIYKGVSLSHNFSHSAVIMDIGGGSTEFISAEENGMNWAKSFDIGVSRIFQQLGEPENFGESEINQVRSFLENSSQSFFDNLQSDLLIGASGSFETLYEMVLKETYPTIGSAIEIPFNKLLTALNWSIRATLEERMNNEWIVPIRKKMLPVAAVKIVWVLEQLQVSRVKVSPYALKEGVFAEEF